jgi:cell fate regulator YaaT (PSP1 superfamily)
MHIAQIQFTPWDKIYYFNSDDIDLTKGDRVVVKTNMGKEIGEVVGIIDSPDGKISCDCPNKEGCPHGEIIDRELKPVLRLANSMDLEKMPDRKEKKEALEYCKKLIDKYELPMKLVDVHFAFDGSRVTFAFIADTRVDFRELVKDLTRHFNKTIRLQQIGIRDEAKFTGDYGHCGKPLCCRGFLKNLESITSEMAEIQQCAHRGSERISGVCGRLMCCLAYEQKGYEELEKKLPPIGKEVNIGGKKGVVVGHHILKQSVDVELHPEDGDEESTVVELDLNKDKTN